MNSSPQSSQISRSSAAASSLHARARSPSDALVSSLQPGLLHLPQHAHERQLDVVAAGRSGRARESAGAASAASACMSTRVGGRGVLDVGGDPALLAQLVERVGAAGRIEQVGGDRVSCARLRGPRRAPWRRGRSPGARRRARTSSVGASTSPASATARRRRDAEAPRPGSPQNSSPSGVSGGADGDRHLARRQARGRPRGRPRWHAGV